MTQSVAINLQPNEVKQICAKVADLAQQTLAVARVVQAMRIPTTAYAAIGKDAAAASTQANQAVSQTVQQLSALLRTINDNVVLAANRSAQWDANSGQNLSALSTAAQPAAGTAAAPTTPAPAAVAATPVVATGSATPLGTAVRLAGAGQLPEPHSVEHVLNTLSTQSAVPGQNPPPSTVVSSPANFGAWISDPQHQASLGLTQVGAGPSAFTAMQPGDVVVGAVQGDPIIAFVGDDMNLYNAGAIGPASTLSSVQGVYRTTNPSIMTA
jgi:hypothetical protein